MRSPPTLDQMLRLVGEEMLGRGQGLRARAFFPLALVARGARASSRVRVHVRAAIAFSARTRSRRHELAAS